MPDKFDVDEEGTEFCDADSAYLDAHRAALDICIDMLRQRCDPGKFRFEICDENGQLVMELPFAEVVRPGPPSRLSARSDLGALVEQQMGRNARLKKEISAQFVQAFGHVQEARMKLGLPRRA